MHIYLAHPIDFSDGEITSLWALIITEALLEDGHLVFDPTLPADALEKMTPAEVWSRNQQAIADADAVFALLPPGVRSIGVPMEIEHARMIGKAIIVICNERSYQLMGAGIRVYDWEDRRLAIGQLPAEVGSAAGAAHFADPPEDLLPAVIKVAGIGIDPEQSHPGDAGFDLVVAEDVTIEPGQTVNVAHNIHFEFPSDMWGLLVGRSSSMRRRSLLVSQAVIDSGYRGAMFTTVTNLSQTDKVVSKGERISQLIPMSLVADRVRFERVSMLGQSDRGFNGFGSTGF